jgi:hypothetical protein
MAPDIENFICKSEGQLQSHAWSSTGAATTSATTLEALFQRSVAPDFRNDQLSPEATFSETFPREEDTNERAPDAISETSPEFPKSFEKS